MSIEKITNAIIADAQQITAKTIEKASCATTQVFDKEAGNQKLFAELDALAANAKTSVKSQKTVFTEEQFEDMAYRLRNIGEQTFENYYAMLLDAFKDTDVEITGRLKEVSSILPKLKRISYRLKPDITDAKLTRKLSDVCAFKAIIRHPDDVEDAIGAIQKLISNEKVVPAWFVNYGKKPIFDKNQVQSLTNMGFEYKSRFNLNDNLPLSNIYFDDKRGYCAFELQAIGNKTDKLLKKEHIYYNFHSKGVALENGKVNERMNKVYKRMTDEQHKIYRNYIDKCYAYVRAQELGDDSFAKPKLPKGLSELLKLL